MTFTASASLNVTGVVNLSMGYNLNGTRAVSATAPMIASGGCTSPSILKNNGTAAFAVAIGSSCSGVSTVVLTMPAAVHGWVCNAHDITNNAANAVGHSAGGNTSSVTLTNYARTTGLAQLWTANDVIAVKCMAS